VVTGVNSERLFLTSFLQKAMPIVFISLNDTFTEKIRQHGYEAHTKKIQDYVPHPMRKTYYVSPANSLCFMDGGIDYALSRVVFPGIESRVKDVVRGLGIQSLLGRHYLPIGSSVALEDDDGQRFLVVAPTMLLPQDVSSTRNAYFATMAVLYNVLVHRCIDDAVDAVDSSDPLEAVDILLPSFCCGYGKMDVDTAVQQIVEGIRDYRQYAPFHVGSHAVVLEPNLLEQPKYYQNTEWFRIQPDEILLAA